MTWPIRRAAALVAGILGVVGCPLAGPTGEALAQAVPPPPGAGVPAAQGYWMAAADGTVVPFGGASAPGDARAARLSKPIVAMATSRTGRGYWLVATDGGIFAFGDAPFLGSTGRIRLNKPIVGMAATPSGAGYWLVASDGGVFSFGDAVFRGSTGAIRLNSPVVAMAATPSGAGYWLVASDGGVFAFGDAAFRGSTGGIKLVRPVVGAAASPSGRGYWLVASDGGVFAFGDAAFRGSTGAVALQRPIVGVAATPRGIGYWLVASDGGIFAFGDATFAGSSGGFGSAAPVVSLAAAPVRVVPEVAAFFYPWYARQDRDGVWRHWEANGRQPPADVAADFYPVRGAYSSSDPAVLDAQMADLAAAGVDVVVSSWWGRGSFEDTVLAAVAQAAAVRGVRLAIHLEPYPGRTVERMVDDVAYFRALGLRDVFVYEAALFSSASWALARPRLGDVRLFAESGNLTSVRSGAFADFARAGGFDGVYSYDPVRYVPADFTGFCASARQARLLCGPSVAPGHAASRTKPADLRIISRDSGARYDAQWLGAVAAGADIVTITSYNEWHEGSQIEAARPYCFPDGICSPGYDGAYGLSGEPAQGAYIQRTRVWADAFHRG